METSEVSPITTALIRPPNAFLNGRGTVELQWGLEVTHPPGTLWAACVLSHCRKKKGCTCRVLRVGSELHTMSLPFSPPSVTLLFPRCIPAMGHCVGAVVYFQEGRIAYASVVIRCSMCWNSSCPLRYFIPPIIYISPSPILISTLLEEREHSESPACSSHRCHSTNICWINELSRVAFIHRHSLNVKTSRVLSKPVGQKWELGGWAQHFHSPSQSIWSGRPPLDKLEAQGQTQTWIATGIFYSNCNP